MCACADGTAGLSNLAFYKQAYSSSKLLVDTDYTDYRDNYGPNFAIDGSIDFAADVAQGGFFQTAFLDTARWLSIDLGSLSAINQLVLYNRIDCCGERLVNAEIRIGNVSISTQADTRKLGQNALVWKQPAGHIATTNAIYIITLPKPVQGRWVTLQNLNSDSGKMISVGR